METYQIREARPQEHAALGRLIADVYAALPGMPGPGEQPAYYAMLLDVAKRAANPVIHVYAAAAPDGDLLGSVDFIEEMRHYGSGGSAREVPDAAGIRLLAVRPDQRGRGIGKALTVFCIGRARALGRSAVILHTTRAMQTAWELYARIGFRRLEEIDFRQGNLEVFGFRLDLAG